MGGLIGTGAQGESEGCTVGRIFRRYLHKYYAPFAVGGSRTGAGRESR